MKLQQFLSSNLKRIIAFLLVIVLLICSISFLGKIFTDPQTYSETVKSIDEKKATVLGVSAAVAGSATILAAAPGDSTTPLAGELMDLSSYLAIVVCILVLEKSLLTVFGAAACYLFLPIACFFTMGFIVKKDRLLISWAVKFLILAIALLAIVPCSMKLSDYIYEINQVELETEADDIIEETESTASEEEAWYTKLWNTVTNVVLNTAEAAEEWGKKALNKFIDAVSVFVIAYCAIPILIIFAFLGLLKFLFGLNINIDLKILNQKNSKTKKVEPEKVIMLNE